MFSRTVIFRQLFDRTSCTYTYLLADAATRAALLIDPVLECAERDVSLVNELGLKLRYVMNTHVHADHVTGSGLIKQLLKEKANIEVKSVISKESGANADLCITENYCVTVGSVVLKARHTPGHTNGCMCYVEERHGLVFTGDTLLIRGCGRTDFQNGSASQLYDSVQSKLFTLPDQYLVFPAHDYKGQTCSTIGEEKRFNPRLSKSKDEFIQIMQNLNLEKPKLIDIAVPKNMVCGC